MFKEIMLGCIAFGIIFYIFCIAISPIFIKIFYPSVYNSVIQYNLIVNLGIIVGFVASLLATILMSQGELKALSKIQAIWGISYIVVAPLAVSAYGLWGLAFVTLGLNAIKTILVVTVSYSQLRHTSGQDENSI